MFNGGLALLTERDIRVSLAPLAAQILCSTCAADGGCEIGQADASMATRADAWWLSGVVMYILGCLFFVGVLLRDWLFGPYPGDIRNTDLLICLAIQLSGKALADGSFRGRTGPREGGPET